MQTTETQINLVPSIEDQLTLAKSVGPFDRGCGVEMEENEAEGHMIDTLRKWQRASHDEAYRDHLDTWSLMEHEVDMYLMGRYTMENARQVVGSDLAAEHFGAVVLVAQMLKHFAPNQPGNGTL